MDAEMIALAKAFSSGDYLTDQDIDATLTQPGQAADAAAVGDRLSTLSEEKVSQADLGEGNVVSFKNSAGLVLFTLDLSGLGTPATYGNLVLSVESLTVAEGGEGTFTVALDSAPSANQIVYLAVSDNTRLSVSPETLTFTPENWNTPQTVTVSSAQDDDNVDDSITVTLTSKNVGGKLLVVTVSDNYYVPQLVTDGLVMHFDYKNRVNDTSTTITDLVNGVVAKNWDQFPKNTNGVYGDQTSTTVWLSVDTSTEAYAAFKAAFASAAKNGFTFETFGTFHWPCFFYGTELTIAARRCIDETGASSGSDISNPNAQSYSATAHYVNLSGESVKLGTAVSIHFNVDGNDSLAAEIPNVTEYMHRVIIGTPDGKLIHYLNGRECLITAEATDFASWDIETMTSLFYLLNIGRMPSAESNYMSCQRVYNRPLTLEEITQNCEAEKASLGLSTF